jgi:hypothetical protein
MINFENQKKYSYPFDYLVIDDCFDTETLDKLLDEWPSDKLAYAGSVMGGRRQISNTGAEQAALGWMGQSAPTWKSFYDYLNTDEMMNKFKKEFQPSLDTWGCTLEEDDSIFGLKMFLHVDWSEAGDGYVREIHADSQKRFVNFLIFFNDKQWDGGDFVIHSSDNIEEFPAPGGNYVKHYTENDAPIHEVVQAKKNRAIFFLSSPNSLHSVSKQENTKEYRKFIYGAYSRRDKMRPVFSNYTNTLKK